MRNPLTNLIRKRSRRSTSRGKRNTYCSSPIERLCSTIFFGYAMIFTKLNLLFGCLVVKFILQQDIRHSRIFLARCRLSMAIVQELLEMESATGDVHGEEEWRHHRVRRRHIRLASFQTNDHCEGMTRFTVDEINDLINRFELEETTYVHAGGGGNFITLTVRS